MNTDNNILIARSYFPDGRPVPDLMTEKEVIEFLRIPEVSSSRDHHNVIEHLKRYRRLPRIRICNRVLYPRDAIRKWIEKETTNGN